MIDTTEELIAIYPNFDSIAFQSFHTPNTNDSGIIFCTTAAFTLDKKMSEDHGRICGPHLERGIFYPGYQSELCNGAFWFRQGRWGFLKGSLMDSIRQREGLGSMAFCQIRLDTAIVSIPADQIYFDNMGLRFYRNLNDEWRLSVTTFHYRALCEKDGRLCIVESRDRISLAGFRRLLSSYGIDHALYLDAGPGWNHAWYRDNENRVRMLHGQKHPFNSNWILFFKQHQ